MSNTFDSNSLNDYNLEFASFEERSDKSVVLNSVFKSGSNLKWASEDLKMITKLLLELYKMMD